jgi:RNA polymerase sigma factor (sigma-70 family)
VAISDHDDAELVRRARSGDKEAFALLVTRHRPTVLALTRRVLADLIGATDATSEATVTALMNLDRLRSPDRFGAWYVGIGLNVARRWLRQPATSRLGEEIADAGLGPEDRAEAAEAAHLVRRAVEQLAPGQRQAVLAFYFQGLSHIEPRASSASVPVPSRRGCTKRAALLHPNSHDTSRERKVHP